MASNAKIIGDLIAADASVAIPGDGVILASDLADGSVTTAKLADANVTIGKIATTVPLGTKNLIINGDMKIAQRGTSVTSLSSGYGYKTVDRFMFDTSGTIGTWTMSQDSDVPSGQGFSNSVKYTCTSGATKSADAQLRLNQYIEAQNLQHLKYGTANAESTTLSFWVKSNKTGTFAVWMLQFDTGTAKTISQLVTISSADTWEKKTLTYAGDTSGQIDNDNGTGLLLVLQFVAGTDLTSGTLATSWENITTANLAAGQTIDLCDTTSNYINITGVQLEVGDTATPFEHLPLDMQLQKCKRYYEKSIEHNVGSPISQSGSFNQMYVARTTSNNYGIYYNVFKVEKRASPTVTIYGYDGTLGQLSNADSGANIGAGGVIHNNTVGFVTKNASGGNIGAQMITHNWTAESEL